MKKLATLFLFIFTTILWAQQPYYNDVNLSLTGQELYNALQAKISNASSSFNYGQVRETMKITDLDPENSNNVLLLYGYNDDDGNCTTDRTRHKDQFGGGNCEYNREHTFPRSLANPPMGAANNSATGIVADPHNIRPADQQMNNNRGNRKLGDGSGTAGINSADDWYPGDEWKGDVARMMMYMYVRYGDQCLPSLNGNGNLEPGTDMLEMYLRWNAEDPVNEFEDQRNPYLESVYGNRNPFIDNPYLATLIWGGPEAEDRWGAISTTDFNFEDINVYPNPTAEVIWVESSTSFPVDSFSLYDTTGRLIIEEAFKTSERKIDVSNLNQGVYLLELNASNKKIVKKILVR